MSETEIIHEEPNIPDTPITSEEDKFFGKTTEGLYGRRFRSRGCRRYT